MMMATMGREKARVERGTTVRTTVIVTIVKAKVRETSSEGVKREMMMPTIAKEKARVVKGMLMLMMCITVRAKVKDMM